MAELHCDRTRQAASSRRGQAKPAPRRFWLMKTEPETFSWKDLTKSTNRTTMWEGVRNFQARNLMRDQMKVGDGVLFYHSGEERAVMGLARVASKPYPDPTQFDTRSKYYDPKSTPEEPRWILVDVQAVLPLPEPLPLSLLREQRPLGDMMLLRRGARLSVQPVAAKEWKAILKLAGVEEP